MDVRTDPQKRTRTERVRGLDARYVQSPKLEAPVAKTGRRGG